MPITIRLAAESDVHTLYQLTRALAIYERKPEDQILVTEEKLRKWGFGYSKLFSALVAFSDDVACGMALFFFTYAGSLGEPILYLEDLFVLPQYRGNRIGTMLLTHLSKIATDRDCCRIEWHVFSWNEAAINFYRSLNAIVRDDLKQVRLEQTAFERLRRENGDR